MRRGCLALRTGKRRALAGQRILITGATGFVGKALVERLRWSVPEAGPPLKCHPRVICRHSSATLVLSL